MKNIFLLGILIVSFLLYSCHFLEVRNNMANESITMVFNPSMSSIRVGDLEVLNIEFFPNPSYTNKVTFISSNPSVVKIKRVTNTSCVVEGIKSGSTIITAILNENMGQAVIIVK